MTAPTVYAAISVWSVDLPGGIPKDPKNQQQQFQFRGINQFIAAVAPVIERNGLVVFPPRPVA